MSLTQRALDVFTKHILPTLAPTYGVYCQHCGGAKVAIRGYQSPIRPHECLMETWCLDCRKVIREDEFSSGAIALAEAA